MSRRKRNKKIGIVEFAISVLVLICIFAYGYLSPNLDTFAEADTNNYITENVLQKDDTPFDLSTIPEYSSSPYVVLNNNIPNFSKEDYTTNAFEQYSKWDDLNRSGVAFANICKETMPKDNEERGDIGSVNNLSGWVQKRYDGIVDGNYLYNRSHLIGWQLSAENANKENLITGTRYMNTEGMLPFENQVAEYLDDNENNHVLYRVTPIFDGNNLLASGVQMEAWSVEDNGKGVCFNVYCYNVQPGIVIDYATGNSHKETN